MGLTFTQRFGRSSSAILAVLASCSGGRNAPDWTEDFRRPEKPGIRELMTCDVDENRRLTTSNLRLDAVGNLVVTAANTATRYCWSGAVERTDGHLSAFIMIDHGKPVIRPKKRPRGLMIHHYVDLAPVREAAAARPGDVVNLELGGKTLDYVLP